MSLHARRNFALVEDETVHFGPGLNVITGESGSGKSVWAGLQSREHVVQHAGVNSVHTEHINMVPQCTPVHA